MTHIAGFNSRNWKPRQQSVQAIAKTEADKQQDEQKAMKKWLEAIGRSEEA